MSSVAAIASPGRETSPSPIRREVGSIALMLTGLGSIIGSGWLFGAWRAAGLAGPSAVWAWVPVAVAAPAEAGLPALSAPVTGAQQ